MDVTMRTNSDDGAPDFLNMSNLSGYGGRLSSSRDTITSTYIRVNKQE